MLNRLLAKLNFKIFPSKKAIETLKNRRFCKRFNSLTEQEINIIQETIYKIAPKANIYIFGSRATNTNKKYSDIDIAIDNNGKKINNLELIKYHLSESELPYKVDILDINDVDVSFLELIRPSFILLNHV